MYRFPLLLLLCVLGVVVAEGQVTPLLTNNPMERVLKGSESHVYQLTLIAGEYTRVVVEQRNVNAKLSLLMADGTELFGVDDTRDGLEVLHVVAEEAATFHLQISAVEAEAVAGRYVVRRAETRVATPRDCEEFTARRLAQEAARLYRRRDSASSRQAVEKSLRAVALFQGIGENVRAGDMLNLAGQSYELLGEYDAARRVYEQALTWWRRGGDRAAEAVTLNLLGRLFSNRGEYQSALDCFNQAVTLARATGSRDSTFAGLDLLGITYKRLGEFAKAKAVYQQLLEQAPTAATAAERLLHEANALNGLGMVAVQVRDFASGIEYFKRSLELMRQRQDPLAATMLLGNLGGAYRRKGDWSQALEHLLPALQQYRALGNRRGEANMQSALGDVYVGLARPAEAREAYKQALALTEALGMERESALIYGGLARLERSAGQPDAARAQIEQALRIIEAQRTQLISPDLRAAFLASRRHAYDTYVDVLLRLSEQRKSTAEAVAAFQASESSRARALMDLLNEGAAQLLAKAEPQLAARESELQRQIEAKSNEAAPSAELERLLAEYDQVRAQIRQRHPQYATLTQPEPLTLSEVQRQVLDADTVLLEYYLGTDRSHLFVVTPTALHTFALPPRSELETTARKFYETLVAFGQSKAFKTIQEKQAWRQQQEQLQQRLAAQLSQSLLAPARQLLEGKRLLIVPDGALHYIPFAALPVAGKATAFDRPPTTNHQPPLIVRHEIITMPSASTLAMLRRINRSQRATGSKLAVFADPVFGGDDERFAAKSERRSDRSFKSSLAGLARTPDRQETTTRDIQLNRLPASRQEAEAIAALVPEPQRKLALGFDVARADILKEELTQYRYLHFATHGLLDNEHPELSALVLSLVDQQGAAQDGFLRTMDVFNLKLNADLVVLSGCQTALGKEVNGEGLIGLTRGFMSAGARRVLASLWQVNDDATAELMQRFYQGMLGKKKLSPAAALREAQLTIFHTPRWQSPYYWAAFTLQGDW